MTTINIGGKSFGTMIWEPPEHLQKILSDELIQQRVSDILMGHFYTMAGILMSRGIHDLLSVLAVGMHDTTMVLELLSE